MPPSRIGLWFIGAHGGVASTATLGLLALERGRRAEHGLVSALPAFAGLDLVPWRNVVVGGHEIRSTTFAETLLELVRNRALDLSLVDDFRDALLQLEGNIEQGIVFNSGPTIEALSDMEPSGDTARAAIESIKNDLREFAQREDLSRVVVVNVASTEPAVEIDVPNHWAELEPQLDRPGCPLPASSLYAIAAFEIGMPYVNFTPSLGATPAAIQDLARLQGTCHAGQDGKTGETMMKSVLAPMFAQRNLEVLSWVGHNIFGNMDGQVLDNPVNKAAKVKGKDQILRNILGYDPQTLVTIEYIRSMGDWKTAWDHIHFRGFLGTPMTLQFTWQGCDSLLAAPLVLDLVRFVELSHRRSEIGVLSHLGSFFKSPLGLVENGFAAQFSLLEAWADRHSSRS